MHQQEDHQQEAQEYQEGPEDLLDTLRHHHPGRHRPHNPYQQDQATLA
jgi:hypothetical protein